MHLCCLFPFSSFLTGGRILSRDGHEWQTSHNLWQTFVIHEKLVCAHLQWTRHKPTICPLIQAWKWTWEAFKWLLSQLLDRHKPDELVHGGSYFMRPSWTFVNAPPSGAQCQGIGFVYWRSQVHSPGSPVKRIRWYERTLGVLGELLPDRADNTDQDIQVSIKLFLVLSYDSCYKQV